MCNNRCNGSCNRCESTCDPCRKQPKIYYCGGDISCAGVTRGEEISRAIKKLGDKLCQTANQQNPLTYVNIEDATEEQCETGGFVVQILQVGSDNLVSEHILCNGGEDFQFSEDISCGRYVVVEQGFDTQSAIKNVVRYFCEKTEGYIPLSGTEVDNPVTGSVEVSSSVYGEFMRQTDELEYINKIIFLGDEGIGFERVDLLNNKTSKIGIGNEGVGIDSDNPNFIGLTSNQYYGQNYFGNTYVQRRYVDNAMIPLGYGDTVTSGGIENAQVYTTGSGTGIASVNLSPTMLVGKDVTVSDLGNSASTHNIQIDAGLGNTILYNGVASQDITLNTDGASVTIRKMTANQFMVITKN